VDVFAAAESIRTHHPPLLEQPALCHVITARHFPRHIRHIRDLSGERRSVLLDGGRH